MTISAKIPYSFLLAFGHVTWKDIEFGLAHNYISPAAAIDCACSKIAGKTEPDPDEMAVASSSTGDPILEVVHKLAEREPDNNTSSSKKWLFLLLAWLYENRATIIDPLSIIEEIYVDFDYPPEIAPFVRYMPMEGPDLGSKEKNEARLIARWGEFVKTKSQLWRHAR